jgi:hypothetical protein
LGHTVTKQRNRKHFTKKQRQITKQKQETNLQKKQVQLTDKTRTVYFKKIGKGVAICLKACQDLKRCYSFFEKQHVN